MWCFAPNEPKKIFYHKKLICDQVGGLSFSSEVQARAELVRLQAATQLAQQKEQITSSTKVWCVSRSYTGKVTKISITKARCDSRQGKSFLVYADAQAEQKRLKETATASTSGVRQSLSRSREGATRPSSSGRCTPRSSRTPRTTRAARGRYGSFSNRLVVGVECDG